jgi:hypothetical protein
MLIQKMPECHEQLRSVPNTAAIQSLMNIFDHHGPDALSAAGLLQ